MNTETAGTAESGRRGNGFRIFLIILVTVLVTVGITLLAVKYFLFPSAFRPVELSTQEEQVLNDKLERLDSMQYVTRKQRRDQKTGTGGEAGDEGEVAVPGELEPEPYSEEGADRTITLSERELNALLAKNTDLARKLAIDLSDDLVSAKLLVPVDEDFPVMGGRILKVRAGVELAYQEGRAVVILKGVSIMGVPIPNAWLGGLKNIDLVEQYGTDTGFWKSFSDGVQDIRIADGSLQIELKE
jgi:hypothetical protein